MRALEISPTCEHVDSFGDYPRSAPTFCGEPTTHYYPAWGGGTMALCERHAQKHLAYALPVPFVWAGRP